MISAANLSPSSLQWVFLIRYNLAQFSSIIIYYLAPLCQAVIAEFYY